MTLVRVATYERKCVSWKSRDSPSARLESALDRWNPVEQTGLYIYSCSRIYRALQSSPFKPIDKMSRLSAAGVSLL